MTVDAHASAVEIARRVRTGEWSAVEVARVSLEEIGRIDGVLGAFAAVTRERAFAQAAAVDAAVARGEDPGALAGVPLPIKELTEVEGLPFEAGSAALAGNVGVRTAAVAQRLMDAGSVTVGTTAAPEFGFPPYTEPEGRLPAVTPWDTRRGAGGSSGGAAAAVASGMVPIAHASDGGGSIRIPASACGVVGHKPSRGLVSVLPTGVPGPGLVSEGVITRTVADTALGLDVLAPGHGFSDALASGPGRLRIGVLTTPAISERAVVHPACADAVATVAGWLSDLGHEVVDAPPPFAPARWSAFDAIWATGAASIPVPPEVEDRLRPLTAWLRARGRQVSGVAYAEAVAAIQVLGWEVDQTWADLDVVLTPTLAEPPAFVGAIRNDSDPAADFAAQCDHTPWTSVANLTGRPSTSLPLVRADVDDTELPIGVMFTGRLGHDHTLLQLAATLESAHPWPLTRR
ncbi:MAG: amidase, partial [Propionibacteriaceae bacterium]|nr:amidase [Propionibacteriaceae bacterium]